MNLDTILAAIGSTEPSTFQEFCSALDSDCPESGDRIGWRAVFELVRDGERRGWIDVDRVGGKIDSMILTDAGATHIKSVLDARRPLLRN